MQISGILPALVTPLDDDGQFLEASLEALLERCYTCGVHGVYVGGQTGEGLLQAPAMREQVIDVVVKNSPADKAVVAHVGAGSTAEAVGLAKAAERLGVHAISSLPPSAAGSFADVERYFAALASATELPLYVYYFPERSKHVASEQALEALLGLPNVAGVKFTDYDLYTLAGLKQSDTTVFNGRDEVLAAGLLMGADGGIGSFYNLLPDAFVGLYDCARGGDWSGARERQDHINRLIRLTLRYPMLAAIKQMLTWSGIPSGAPIPPHAALTPDQEKSLREELAAAGFAPDGFCRAEAC